MNIFPIIAIGVATHNSNNEMIDVRYQLILNKDQELFNGLNLKNPGFEELKSMIQGSQDSKEFEGSLNKILSIRDNQKIVMECMEEDIEVSNICDAYIKLYLLSLRISKPNSINLDGIFAALPNVAWTNLGPVDPKDIDLFRSKYGEFSVRSVDKFPPMTDYVIPSGVRIADSSRVRLGAYLSEGTTIMHEGFVNFNAGTLGAAMIEGRISAGVVIGKNSDLGGGCSTMGTLSGGNDVKISVGEDCLLGANSGLGIPLGDRCIVEAGLYLTGGSKVEVLNSNRDLIETVKASSLSGQNDLLFIRNSLTGSIQCSPNQKSISLNEALHKND
jgi:2,3,4,5-tetrahydropyridine-2-carboxylate N-succinyltransferase|tara:strand:- start:2573 stop:3562 length:990 start_codon:yes stop_codon:yes gene_type:complete